jgi:3'(2'), 5'-bisphosphate nucleotidase
VYIPETGPHGTWVEACGERIVCGEDDTTRPAEDVLRSIPPVDPATRPQGKEIYLIGFQDEDQQKAQLVTDAGLLGRTVDEMPGSIFELFSRGKYGGSLIHSPNIYDFPVTMHIARILGGDAVWTHNRQPVNFRELWNDERVDMLRLPGIVACSDNRQTLETLCDVAAGWSSDRYTDEG